MKYLALIMSIINILYLYKIENLRNVGIVVFDKTGTLTKGQFFVKEIQTVNIEKEKLLEPLYDMVSEYPD